MQMGREKDNAIGKSFSKRFFLIAFTIPTLMLFMVFVLIPILQGLYYSFFQWNGVSENKTFVAFGNYLQMLQDEAVHKALLNDLKVAVLRMLATLVFSLGLSIILTRFSVLGNQFFRNILFFPVMLSAVVICTIWMMIYNPNFGVLSTVLGKLGIATPEAGWLGDSKTALYTTIIPAVWCSVGFYMIIFMSAIESIPMELFESATVDGASKWKQIIYIILPLLKPQINFCVVYVVISSMNGSYLFVKLLTEGGPNGASEVLGTLMTKNAFTYHQFGYATAIATLILLVTFLMTRVLNRIFKSEAYEY